jgi:hypothetical protein
VSKGYRPKVAAGLAGQLLKIGGPDQGPPSHYEKGSQFGLSLGLRGYLPRFACFNSDFIPGRRVRS